MPARGASIEVRPRGVTAPASPTAVRARHSRWRDPRLVVGVAVVAACTLLGARLVGNADDTVGVWSAGSALSAGQPVVAADLVRREVRFAGQDAADAYLSADSPLPSGARLARAVGPGELVPRGALGGAGSVPLTEVPLSVATEAVPSTVRVGSVVDVWVTPDSASADAAGDRGAQAARAALVFDDVAVVSVPRTGSSLGPTATRQVIVGIDEEQQARLPVSLAALAGGTVLLTARR
jgi:hypothetical protein